MKLSVCAVEPAQSDPPYQTPGKHSHKTTQQGKRYNNGAERGHLPAALELYVQGREGFDPDEVMHDSSRI